MAGRILDRSAAVTTQRASDWLGARDDPAPFFLWVHYFDPHLPHIAPEPYASRFADSKYDGEIAYMDSQIGRLLQTLSRTGARDRTLNVVVGDHGEGLGEHNEGSHGFYIYDYAMHVPLIIVAPLDGLAGKRVPVQVRTADLFPTVLDLAGLALGGEVHWRTCRAGPSTTAARDSPAACETSARSSPCRDR